MLNLSKSGQTVYILYGAKNYTSSLTIVAEVYNPSNAQIAASPITLSEIGTTGLYGGTFTPAAGSEGEYKIKIQEGSQYRAHASIKITEHDIVSVGGEVTSILDIVQHATYGNSAIVDRITGIEGTGFATSEDSLSAIRDYLVNTIQSSIANISNNTRTSVAIPTQMLKPNTGNNDYRIYVNVYDTEGNMEDPDDQNASNFIAINVVDESGNDRTGNLQNVTSWDSRFWLTRDSQGRFYCDYRVADTHDIEQVIFNFTYLEGGLARGVDRSSLVTGALDLSTTVNNIYDEVTNASYGLSALQVLLTGYFEDGGSIETRFDGIDANLISAHSKIDQIDTVVDGNNTLLTNATFGLSALQTLMSAIQTAVGNNATSLSEIQGSGFVSVNDSMKAMSDRQLDIQGTGYDGSRDSLVRIRAELNPGGYIA